MYQPDPVIRSQGQAYRGHKALAEALKSSGGRVVLVDTYHAPGCVEFVAGLSAAWGEGATWFDTSSALKDPGMLGKDLAEYLTDDPVFGRVCDRDIDLFFDGPRWLEFCRRVRDAKGPVVVTGPGAMSAPLRNYADLAVIAQVPRETVFTSTLRNLGDDRDRSNWERYKRSFYVDWPVLNRHQFRALPACDLLVDITTPSEPTFVSVNDAIRAFGLAAQQPFRVRSLFMPGVWGGTRLRELIPDLPQEWPNCAWGFELVGPENTVTFELARTRTSRSVSTRSGKPL